MEMQGDHGAGAGRRGRAGAQLLRDGRLLPWVSASWSTDAFPESVMHRSSAVAGEESFLSDLSACPELCFVIQLYLSLRL